MTETQSAVVLLSGGMDSAALLFTVCRRLGARAVHAVSFVYGQRHARELEMARHQAEEAGVARHEEIDLSFVGRLTGHASSLTGTDGDGIPRLADLPPADRDQPSTYVPNRNMVFLSVAAMLAEGLGAADVFYGAQAQDMYGYWDCTSGFVEAVNGVLRLNRRRPVKIHAPFVDKGKAEVLRIGLNLGVDYAHTWTCYRGAQVPCRECPTCVERAAAFREVGVEDPLDV